MGCVDVKVYNHPQCKTCPWNSSRTVEMSQFVSVHVISCIFQINRLMTFLKDLRDDKVCPLSFTDKASKFSYQ